MPTLPIPVQRYLVPEIKPVAPEGFERVDRTIVNSLPDSFELIDGLKLVLTIANGLATTWRETDPTAIVSRSDEELAPSSQMSNRIIGDVTRAPARMLLRDNGVTIAAVPLVAGLRTITPSNGESDRGLRIELVVLGWDLRAGNFRGPGEFGSKISFAWRQSDKAIDHFSTPPINPKLIPRLEPKFRMYSILGSNALIPLARFKHKQSTRKAFRLKS